jgi:hypothetical protein
MRLKSITITVSIKLEPQLDKILLIKHQYHSSDFNPLKTKLVCILFKNSVRTSTRTPNFAITKINWLTMLKEIIAVYSENHTKPINTKCSITDWKADGSYSYSSALKGQDSYVGLVV